MSISKTSKMLNFINYRMRVTIQDSRQLVGTFMAFDKHMNLVLGDCMEYRKVKGKKGEGQRVEKRTLGLVLLRGETVVSMQIEAQPPQKPRTGTAGKGGAGVARPTGRPLPPTPLTGAPAGLGAPIAGAGGPQGPMMQPQMIQQPPRTIPGGLGGMPPSGPPLGLLPGMPGNMPPPPGVGLPPPGMPGPGQMPPGMRQGMPPMGMPIPPPPMRGPQGPLGHPGQPRPPF